MKTAQKYIFMNRGAVLDHPVLRNMIAYFSEHNKPCVTSNIRNISGIKVLLKEKLDKHTTIIISDPIVCLLVLLIRPSMIKRSIFFSFEMYGYQTNCTSPIRYLKNAVLRLSHYLACKIFPRIVFANALRRNFYIERWKFIENKSFIFENYFRDNKSYFGNPAPKVQVTDKIDHFRKQFSVIICYVGIIVPGRDIEILIDSVDGSNVGLLLAGTDNLNITEKANKSKNICYLGKITYDEACYVYEHSDWGYLNYDNDIPNTRFCSPVKIFEYLAFDLGVISNNNVALKEKNDIISFYYDTQASLHKIISGLHKAEKLSIDYSAINFDIHFEKLLTQICRTEN